MSYVESQRRLTEAQASLALGQCQQAANHYAAVASALRTHADPGRPLTPSAVALVGHYATASRGQSAALAQLGEATAAEPLLLEALAKLRGCLHNLGTPLAQRAPLLTEYKHCFYALVELYFTQNKLDKLTAYAGRHTPELARWAAELQLLNAAASSN